MGNVGLADWVWMYGYTYVFSPSLEDFRCNGNQAAKLVKLGKAWQMRQRTRSSQLLSHGVRSHQDRRCENAHLDTGNVGGAGSVEDEKKMVGAGRPKRPRKFMRLISGAELLRKK